MGAAGLSEPRWWAVTGAPGAGKTTLVEDLAARGFVTQPEVAREQIDVGLSSGKTLVDLRGDEREFHYSVARAKLARDLSLPRDQPIVFDRGLPDSHAFGRHYGWPALPEMLKIDGAQLYAGAILLDRLPLNGDYAHLETEDDEFAGAIDELVELTYRDEGVPVHRIPVATREQRLALAMEIMQRPGS